MATPLTFDMKTVNADEIDTATLRITRSSKYDPILTRFSELPVGQALVIEIPQEQRINVLSTLKRRLKGVALVQSRKRENGAVDVIVTHAEASDEDAAPDTAPDTAPDAATPEAETSDEDATATAAPQRGRPAKA